MLPKQRSKNREIIQRRKRNVLCHNFYNCQCFFRTFHFEVNNILTLIQNVYLTRFDFEVDILLGLCCVCVFFCFFFVFLLCLACPILSVSLDCPFLISHSVFSNVYLLTLTKNVYLSIKCVSTLK
jgi:hypothetical protein